MDAITRIDPVGDDTYRIATFDPTYNISFNQFLIADEKPALIHTGTWQVYDAVRKAIAQVLDPAKLAYVVIPHFEADECGGMRRFVDAAPGCQLVASELGAALNLSGWNTSAHSKARATATRWTSASTACASSRRRTCITGIR